jgi:hypothetical protein
MERRILVGVMACLFLLGNAFYLNAEENPITGNVMLAGLNKYIFRGYELSDKSIVLQPSMGIAYRGFSASFWGNIDTDEHATQSFAPDRPDHKSFNEIDLNLSYTHSWGKLSLSGGYIYYGTKYTAETEEVFASISYDIFLKPTLTVYRDITAYPGTYLNLALSHSLKIYREITLDLGASAGYFAGDSGYWETYESSTGAYTGEKYQAFHDGMVSAGFTIPMGKHFAFQPVVQHWFPLSDKARRKVDGHSYNPSGYLDENWVVGVNGKFSF